MTRGKQVFSDEVAQEIREKYEGGATLRQLEKEYGSNFKTISNTIKRVGGEMRPQHPTKRPKPPTQPRQGTIMAKGPELRKLYEADPRVTVYTLALQYNCHIGTIHRSLVAAGTKMRPAGGDHKSKQTRGLLGWINS